MPVEEKTLHFWKSRNRLFVVRRLLLRGNLHDSSIVNANDAHFFVSVYNGIR